MKREISCEHQHCGHTSLLCIRDSFVKFSHSTRKSSETPQGISTPFLLPGVVHGACNRNICLPVNNGVSRPMFSHSTHHTTPHHTIPSSSRRCRECIPSRILPHISHSFIFPASGAAKVSTEVNIF